LPTWSERDASLLARPRATGEAGGRRIPQDLLLFPSNGNAVEALDCLGHRFRAVGFIDDHPAKIGTRVLGLPVWSRRALEDLPGAKVLAVPGSPSSFHRRADLIASLGLPPDRFATVIHGRASVSRHARIGRNVLVMAGVVVTATAVVGDHVVILPNSVIHHDARVGDFTLVGSSVVVAGFAEIGEGCYIGAGSRVRDHLAVAPRTLIGLGATVVASIEHPGGVWAGTPARCRRASRGEGGGG
jgi:sugar O-acyltransferase (sialic acid O-acetyltransferase NeuD family)